MRVGRRLSRLAFVLLSSSCAARGPATDRPGARAPGTGPISAPTLSELVRDPAFGDAATPQRLGPVIEHHVSEFSLVSDGEHAALARRKHQVFALDETLGVIGPLALPPDTIWVGLAHGDEVFAANGAGTLFRAASIRDATRKFDTWNMVTTAIGRRREDGAAPASLGWDSAGTYLAAVLDATLLVSNDGGVTFDAFVPDPALRLRRVLVRSDGVIVVAGETETHRRVLTDYHRALAARARKGERAALTLELAPGLDQLVTMVSSDGGRHFHKTRFQPSSVERSGMWITGEPPTVREPTPAARSNVDASMPTPSSRVLTTTGSWIEATMPDRPTFREWLGWSASLEAHARAPRVTANDPLPPPPHRPPDDPSAGGRTITISDVCGDTRDYECPPAGCIRGVAHERPALLRWDYGFFTDGECAPRSTPAADERRCPNDAALTRAPSVGIYDRASDALYVTKVPDGCVPHRIETALDAAVLVCGDAQQARRTLVYLGDPEGRWREAGVLDAETTGLAPIGVASDGGILIQEACVAGRNCVAWMHPPSDPRGGFRKVVVPGAVAYRAAPRAATLAFVPAKSGDRFDLVVDTPAGGGPRAILQGIPLPGLLRQALIDHSRLILQIQPSGGQDEPYVVGDDGTLSLLGK